MNVIIIVIEYHYTYCHFCGNKIQKPISNKYQFHRCHLMSKRSLLIALQSFLIYFLLVLDMATI